MNMFLILLAAGNSKRLKSTTPKPFQIVNNKTLLEHSLFPFKGFKQIKKIVIVYNRKHKKRLNKLNLKNILKITGGKTRQESTLLALKKIKNMRCDNVLIHDSARPNPPKELIKKIISSLKSHHAVIPILKATDATKRVQKKFIFKNINRNSLRFSQTPQGFNFKRIYAKHKKNIKTSIDDDSSLFTNDNEKIFTITGSKRNLKITDKEDIIIFKKLQKKNIYFGLGFDVHRLVSKKKLYLGGLKINSKLGTIGHSDGDPVLHALIDAILGACRMGDIGEKFPNERKKLKNIRSTILLKKVIDDIYLKKFYINNIDINIITQYPKIKKYKKKMIKIIANLCNISIKQINIKGKTAEKLGVIGEEKAIASEVIASIIKYD